MARSARPRAGARRKSTSDDRRPEGKGEASYTRALVASQLAKVREVTAVLEAAHQTRYKPPRVAKAAGKRRR